MWSLPPNLLSRPAAYLALGALALLLMLGLVLPTCHTRPASVLTRRQERQVRARRDSALLLARADSSRAAHYRRAALGLRAEARLLDDSATYYFDHAQSLFIPTADSSSLARFWADFFAR